MTPSSVLLTATEKVYLGERAGSAIAAEAERLGAARDQFPKVAEYTMEDFWARTNPRPIEAAADVLPVLELAAGDAG